MFKKVLVANRGEIAVRVMRTLQEMGISRVAVYSDADKAALHVMEADEALCLGNAEPSESYLNIGKIIEAARETGAEAIHPGYGFLAENPDFARAVDEAGLVFIGPPAEVMKKLGDKTTARRLMQKKGVPVIPGMSEAEADKDKLAVAADEIGYPVLIKASAGGGGKGMRVVETPDELKEAASFAESEAEAAFGNGAIYIEKFINKPRHVEFQILCDAHGNAVHLFERECSIQRRHQKIIEETPSTALDESLREEMGAVAVIAAKAAGYVNAGTVEFLLDDEGKFYFLEVNTRLQVEHPITEMVCGLDIVRCQIEIAAGGELPFGQEDVCPRGHAIECRIYAEDPENGFFPSPGKVLLAETPQGPGVRYDSGIFTGAEVPVYYDPIMSKLVVHAGNRDSAIARMLRALEECVVLGVKTPISFMMDVLKSDAFRKGETNTGFIPEHFSDWRQGTEDEHLALMGAALERMAAPAATGGTADFASDTDVISPWKRLGKWDLTS